MTSLETEPISLRPCGGRRPHPHKATWLLRVTSPPTRRLQFASLVCRRFVVTRVGSGLLSLLRILLMERAFESGLMSFMSLKTSEPIIFQVLLLLSFSSVWSPKCLPELPACSLGPRRFLPTPDTQALLGPPCQCTVPTALRLVLEPTPAPGAQPGSAGNPHLPIFSNMPHSHSKSSAFSSS